MHTIIEKQTSDDLIIATASERATGKRFDYKERKNEINERFRVTFPSF